MKLKDYISGTEFKIYLESKNLNKKIITVDDVANMLNLPKKKVYYYLHKMNKKGLIKRVKNGMYMRYPDLIQFNQKNFIEDPIFLLKFQVNPYFISYYTALQIHGLAQRTSNVYYITTTKKINSLENQQYLIKFVTVLERYFFGYIQVKYGEDKICVSDVERTVLDILNRPEYAGGFQEVITSILDIPELDFQKLSNYLTKFDKKILYHRIGYLFDSPVFHETFDIPKSFLQNLKKKIRSINYFNNSNRTGTFNKDWNLIVPLEIATLVMEA
ncbi:MAG: type IV toxin-antitoxin system AbiEi family antitoxin domain-containing protein [Candidatus Helarchaeota archaeon]